MEVSRGHFRHLLLYFFYQKKNANNAFETLQETYGEHSPSKSTCEYWFRRFKSGNFDLEDQERSGAPKKFEDNELLALLDENPCQTLNELARELGVAESSVSSRLHALGKIRKEGKWLPHELTENAIANRYNICFSLLARQRKKSFLWRIVTGDEKWIYYDNPKRRKSWVSPGEPSTSTPKRNIHCHKVMLCIWWDMQGPVYYELLNPGETVNAERYRSQLEHLNDNLMQKRPAIASNRRKVILLHDNARPHVARAVRETLLQLEWEVLPHPAYSPDIAPSDYYLFRLMQNDLADTRFRNVEEVRKWVDNWLASKPSSFYREGITKLPERWEKVISNNGQYFD